MYFEFDRLGENLYLFVVVRAEGSGSFYMEKAFTVVYVFTQ